MIFDFLKKKTSRQEEIDLKAAAHEELGKAQVLSEQARMAKEDLLKAIADAQTITKVKIRPNLGKDLLKTDIEMAQQGIEKGRAV